MKITRELLVNNGFECRLVNESFIDEFAIDARYTKTIKRAALDDIEISLIICNTKCSDCDGKCNSIKGIYSVYVTDEYASVISALFETNNYNEVIALENLIKD